MSKKVICYRVVKSAHPEIAEVSAAVMAQLGGSIGVARCSACFEECVVHNETLAAAQDQAKALDCNIVIICHECHNFMEKPPEATA